MDAMSRAPDWPPGKSLQEAVRTIITDVDDLLLIMQLQAEALVQIFAVLKGHRTGNQLKQLQADYVIKNHRLYRKVEKGIAFVVPKNVRWRIVKMCYDDFGHFGLDKIIGRIQQKFWFPRMRKYAKEHISTCNQCCYYKSKGGKPENCMYYNDTDPVPFRRLYIDHLGLFDRY